MAVMTATTAAVLRLRRAAPAKHPQPERAAGADPRPSHEHAEVNRPTVQATGSGSP